MREISFEMAKDMGLIKVDGVAEISDEFFHKGIYGVSENETEVEKEYRHRLGIARKIKFVKLRGELLKIEKLHNEIKTKRESP
mgnify:CR=1 FL=1